MGRIIASVLGMCTRKRNALVYGWPAVKGDMDGWIYLFIHTHSISFE